MCDPFTAVAIASTAISVGSQVLSAKKQKKAKKEQRKLERLQENRESIRQVREARKLAAQTLVSGQAAGALDSSGVAGGVSSIASQLKSSSDFLATASDIQDRVSKLAGQAATFSAISGIAGTVGSQAFKANKAIKTGEASGLSRDEISTGTIFDVVR